MAIDKPVPNVSETVVEVPKQEEIIQEKVWSQDLKQYVRVGPLYYWNPLKKNYLKYS